MTQWLPLGALAFSVGDLSDGAALRPGHPARRAGRLSSAAGSGGGAEEDNRQLREEKRPLHYCRIGRAGAAALTGYRAAGRAEARRRRRRAGASSAPPWSRDASSPSRPRARGARATSPTRSMTSLLSPPSSSTRRSGVTPTARVVAPLPPECPAISARVSARPVQHGQGGHPSACLTHLSALAFASTGRSRRPATAHEGQASIREGLHPRGRAATARGDVDDTGPATAARRDHDATRRDRFAWFATGRPRAAVLPRAAARRPTDM